MAIPAEHRHHDAPHLASSSKTASESGDERERLLETRPGATSFPSLEPPGQIPKQGAPSLAEVFVHQLEALGVEQAFGVSGGAIALFFDALAASNIALCHCRHETGAAFAATEAHFANDKPAVVFTTTGPGLLNALTGLTAARWDGAKVILVSGGTSASQRGRWATQETSSYTMPQDVLMTKGPLFDLAARIEHPAELAEVCRRLANGIGRPGGFTAHVHLPMGMLARHLDRPHRPVKTRSMSPAPCEQDVEACLRRLHNGSFAVWLGFGARTAARRVRRLIELSGAMTFCSPRAKGIVPEHHPQCVGVTGLGGHEAVSQYMLRERPHSVLVLGSRLGEATSFWDEDLVPEGGFVHVDIDPEVPGAAYPEAETLAIHAEIGQFLDALLPRLSLGSSRVPLDVVPWPATADDSPQTDHGPVRPRVLMQELQRSVVRGSDALVLAESGNAFAWCNHHLRFPSPRYRVSTLFGSMGHAAAGVVGAALARRGKAFAVVGDGSMLMGSELSSAVQYGAKAVWIVLNDSGYGMCRDGHRALGLGADGFDVPQVDFVSWAQAVGADGIRVENERQIRRALDKALEARGPFIVDVVIDRDQPSPVLERFESLAHQGSSKNVAGWEA